MSDMLVPLPWRGTPQQITNTHLYWIKDLGDDVWCDLWLRWPKHDLPSGYNLYIVSFHLEAVDVKWIHQQSQRISARIIVLSDSNYYDWQHPDTVYPYTFYWWHHQAKQIVEWFPKPPTQKTLTHKFSAICNRITQSKLIVFTLLAEYAKESSILKLTNWEGQDSRIKTNNKKLDSIADIFYNKWFGKILKLDDSDRFINVQRYSASPWTPVYQNCALHFTNESFHYSYMQDELGHYCYPGPFITEKTLKCLVGGTGFSPVGQYDTYASLERVGFEFNYKFDTTFDQDPGNISRLEKLVQLIELLLPLDTDEIFDFTKTCSEHNQNHVYSREFYNQCEKYNQGIVNKIFIDFL